MTSTLKPQPISIPVAVRVYPETPKNARAQAQVKATRPDAMIVFDTETTTDPTQRLLFGCYRFLECGNCTEEGLFYAADLSTDQIEALRKYVTNHRAATESRGSLKLITLKEFLDKFFKAAYKGRSLVVGFNLPFDLSRLAFNVTAARREFGGGFSLGLWTYIDEDRIERLDPNRPRITIKHIDTKRSLISFTGRKSPDADDLIPQGSLDGMPQRGYKFRGHFLDLRTLSFALTDRRHTLKSACEAFGVKRGKIEAEQHGEITEAYIDYNRRDVEATAELAQVLLEEFDRHPIVLSATKAFSPASIGKAYLREMGIAPILQRQSGILPYVGFAQTAYFGGRTSAHIRKTPVPVVYTDFLSMYPTVNSLMGLWRFVIARQITVVDHCQAEIIRFLEGLTLNDLFDHQTWKRLTAFVRIIPDGNILPTRGCYNPASNDWQVAINHLYAATPTDALWFSLPDVVVSVILTGRIPKIVDAFRIQPSRDTLRSLRPIKFRGEVSIDPRSEDFFKTVIEMRKRLSQRADLDRNEQNRLDKALKVLANSTSYGIYGQMDRRETAQPKAVRCRGLDRKPYECRVQNPEIPGEFCFPPLASLITGGARLMLGLLEKCVTTLGGNYAMEDTDSMAIVATRKGGLIACEGGELKLPNGRNAVNALSWAQVRKIAKRFESLNPYERAAVPGSVLKIEDCNFEPKTKRRQRVIWCYAISAKRYALFRKDASGRPALLRKGKNSDDNHWSEHGLGHLLNPTELDSEDRDWIAEVWQWIIEGCPMNRRPIPFAKLPAIGKLGVSSPALLNPLSVLNVGKPYRKQIKPFNFLLTCHIKPFGHPIGSAPQHFHLIAQYQTNPKMWTRSQWIDQYSGKIYGITTDQESQDRLTAWIKTYGDVIDEYAHHPESKCAEANGNPADQSTIGLLFRRHVRIGEIVPIGKESNSLEAVETGLLHSTDQVYTVYSDRSRDFWTREIVPKLKKEPLSVLVRRTGFSRRMLIKARAGRVRPHPRNQAKLIALLQCLRVKTRNRNITRVHSASRRAKKLQAQQRSK